MIATSRSESAQESAKNVLWVSGIDIAKEEAGKNLASACKSKSPIDIVVMTAGFFSTETLDEPKWEDEIKTYTTSAIGPVFLVHHLVKANLIAKGAKIILVSSESGSITLRHESEGGGNYAHHASKSALNMVGKLLSLDLKDKGIAVGIVHVSHLFRVSYGLCRRRTKARTARFHANRDDQRCWLRQVLGSGWW